MQSTTDGMGDVPRTDALWNKLACPREPSGSLSEAIYAVHTRSDSPLAHSTDTAMNFYPNSTDVRTTFLRLSLPRTSAASAASSLIFVSSDAGLCCSTARAVVSG